MRLISILLLNLLLTGVSYSYEIIILPEQESEGLVRQCSRGAPKDVTGTWKVTSKIVDALKVHLSEVTELEKKQCCRIDKIRDLEYYNYQIGGLIIRNEKVVYVNAVTKNSWKHVQNKHKAIIACDGGRSFWGVIFNPTTNALSNLAINGPARMLNNANQH